MCPRPCNSAQMKHIVISGQLHARRKKPRLPLVRSVGYQIRMTHRRLQSALQSRIERHGVTLGMWDYLPVLWDDDGLTQRELSNRIGTMEPTTLSAVMSMERIGLVRRRRNPKDRRKINIYLTEKGRTLEAILLPAAVEVVAEAVKGFTQRDTATLLRLLYAIQKNLDRKLPDA